MRFSLRSILLSLPLALLLVITAACTDGENENENDAGNDAAEKETDESDEEDNAANNSEDNSDDTTAEKVNPEEIADVFFNGGYEQIYEQASDAFQGDISVDELEEIGKDIDAEPDDFTIQSKMPINGTTRLVWTDSSDWGLMATVDNDDATILGLQVTPLMSHETDDTLTKNVFSYPFEGEWLVLWGGKNSLVNYHYGSANQRYAYDFLKEKDGYSFDGDQDDNESYHAFGKDVVAPADGDVVTVVNGMEDNVPGDMDPENPSGNHVIIDHGHDEYSLLAHFQEDSIEVSEGDDVKQGDLLGLTGNSGNSSEPHIHFHVMDDTDMENGEAIPIKFADDTDPVQGEKITGN